MPLYNVKVNSYVGCDTRIQVVKCGNPKKEPYLDRDSKYERENSKRVEPSDFGSKSDRKARRLPSGRLSTNAKKSLQRIGGAVAGRFDANESVFLTGTFPGSDFRTQSAIASQSGWIVHRLKAWLYYRLGANVGYYVWEFQRRGTLHLHYVVLVPCPIARSQIISDFREEWIRLIAGASARSGVDLFIGERGRNYFTEREKLQIYAQECYKSSAAYLSKYLGKHKYSDFPPPTRMWGATREARHLVASSVISIEYCHKTLQQASGIAHDLDSQSGTENDKRRFFRHRFSQGFTILLYNDTFRMELSKIQKAMAYSNKTDYYQKAQVLKSILNESGLMSVLKAEMTRHSWADFGSLLSPENELAPVFDAEKVCCSLIEARALISHTGAGGYRSRFNVKNRMSVLISELIEEYDLSVLRQPKPSNSAVVGQSEPTVGLADSPSPPSQMSMFSSP